MSTTFESGNLTEFALYLPAVNDAYQRVIDGGHDQTRRVPSGFNTENLAFWSGKSKLWNYKYALHSVGNYKVGADPRGSMFREHPDFMFFGDSGGYQIGQGTLKGLRGLKGSLSENQAMRGWADNFDAKVWIINWLERYADVAMTLDIPLWAMLDDCDKTPFHRCSEQKILEMTLGNLELIDCLKKGRTKWLNVIHGTDFKSAERWWNAVKGHRYSGWSLAGATGRIGGFTTCLKTVLMMYHDGAFEPGQDWLHVLGVSQPKWTIFLSAIQRELRKTNPKLQVTYDSASPFRSAGERDSYTNVPLLGKNAANWGFKFKKLDAVRSKADPANQEPFDGDSPLADQLLMHHLVVRDEQFQKRRIDNLSNMMLVNHNVWVYLETMWQANQQAFARNRQIPDDYAAVLDFISTVFAAQDWMAMIDANHALLDRVAPMDKKLREDDPD